MVIPLYKLLATKYFLWCITDDALRSYIACCIKKEAGLMYCACPACTHINTVLCQLNIIIACLHRIKRSNCKLAHAHLKIKWKMLANWWRKRQTRERKKEHWRTSNCHHPVYIGTTSLSARRSRKYVPYMYLI